MLKVLILVLFSFPGWTTTFSLLPMEEQIKEADGVIVGHFLKKKSIKLDSGILATQMVFKLQQEWGMQSDLFGMEEVIIHYPGGNLGDLNVQVQGVPHLVVGEKVAIFIKNVNGRYWGLNLGFGTFKIVSYGKDTMLINYLFPTDPVVGQVSYEDFVGKIKTIKNSSLKEVRLGPNEEVPGMRAPASEGEGKKRAIASKTDQEDNRESQSGLNAYWLMCILAVAGGLFRLTRGRDA